MAMGGVLEGTPSWFRRLIMPIVMTIVVVVPILTAWLDLTSEVREIKRDVADMRDSMQALEDIFANQQMSNDTTHDNFREAVQSFEVKQAVMEEKIDRILRLLNQN